MLGDDENFSHGVDCVITTVSAIKPLYVFVDLSIHPVSIK